MKKVISILIICAVALVLYPVYAGPNEINITIKMTPLRITQFLRERPMPMIDDPDFVYDPNSPDEFPDQVPEFTIRRHIKRWIISRFKSECEQGRMKIEKDNDVPQEGGIE